MLYKKLSYDPVKDFRMLALVTDLPVVMEVHPSVPAKTVAEFVAYAKQNPGKLNFGSAGTGGTIHLAGEMFKQMAGVEMVHVPYKGAGPALTDLLSGNIQVMFDTLGTALPPVKAGIAARARRQFGEAQPRSARCADHRRERLSRLSRQRLVRHRGAGKGAGRYRAEDQRQPRPRAERRCVPRFAGKDRLSGAASAQRGRRSTNSSTPTARAGRP